MRRVHRHVERRVVRARKYHAFPHHGTSQLNASPAPPKALPRQPEVRQPGMRVEATREIGEPATKQEQRAGMLPGAKQKLKKKTGQAPTTAYRQPSSATSVSGELSYCRENALREVYLSIGRTHAPDKEWRTWGQRRISRTPNRGARQRESPQRAGGRGNLGAPPGLFPPSRQGCTPAETRSGGSYTRLRS